MRVAVILLSILASSPASAEYLGKLSSNQFLYDSTSNEFGPYGSPFSYNSINNEFGPYGSPFSPQSVNNPYAFDPPSIDSGGNIFGD